MVHTVYFEGRMSSNLFETSWKHEAIAGSAPSQKKKKEEVIPEVPAKMGKSTSRSLSWGRNPTCDSPARRSARWAPNPARVPFMEESPPGVGVTEIRFSPCHDEPGRIGEVQEDVVLSMQVFPFMMRRVCSTLR